MPSPGGKVSGMASPEGLCYEMDKRVRHRLDLPEGAYHTAPRGQSSTRPGPAGVGGCPRAAARSGVATVEGMRMSPSVQDQPWSPGIRKASPAQHQTAHSDTGGRGDQRRRALTRRNRVRDEEIASPISGKPGHAETGASPRVTRLLRP